MPTSAMRFNGRLEFIVMDKFCFKCGAKCVLQPTGEFNVKTGEPEQKHTCPTGVCGHLGVQHLPSVRVPGIWGFLNGAERCPKCKEITFIDP